MKILTVFATGITIFGLAACQHHMNRSDSNENAQLLETIGNIDAFPSSEGNQAKLLKTKKGCQIEFTAFYETGKATEYWSFKDRQLLSARTVISHYADGGLTNPQNLPSEIKIDQSKENVFDIRSETTQKNFQNLLAPFSQTHLQQCA